VDDIEIQIWVTAIGTVLSFVSGWLLYLLSDSMKKKNDISTICKSIISELNDIKTYLETRKKPLLKITSNPTDPSDENLSFHTHHLGISSFDSMLYSGIFRDLDTNTQIKLSKIYGEIKLSNASSTRIWELITKDQKYSTTHLTNVQNYANVLDKKYDEIKDAIPDVISLLNKKINTKPRN